MIFVDVEPLSVGVVKEKQMLYSFKKHTQKRSRQKHNGRMNPGVGNVLFIWEPKLLWSNGAD